MMFFSATYEPEVMNFAEIIVSNPLIIRLLKEEESLDNIKQYYIRCKDINEKYTAITNIYGVITIGQAIIFCHVRFSIIFCHNFHKYKSISVQKHIKFNQRFHHQRFCIII